MTEDPARRFELINADIDGELTGPERAELNRQLLADPAARALHDDLSRLCVALDSMPVEDVPPGFGTAVLASLPARQAVSGGAGPYLRRTHDWPTMRYAAAFAGGLLISALAFTVVVGPRALDSSELAGTLVAANPSRLELDLAEVHGTVDLEGTARAPVVQARLVAVRPVQVIARLEGQEVRLSGFVAKPGEPVELSAAFSRAAVATPAVVEIQVVDEATGAVLRRVQLRPDEAG